MSSEACPSSEVRSRKFLHQWPSYPVQWTRYNSLQAGRQLSILESRILRFRIPVHCPTMMGGVGVKLDLESDSELLVPTLRRGRPGVSSETVQKLGE